MTHSKQSINLLRTAFRTYEVDSSVNTCHVLHLGPNRHFQVEMHVIDLDPKDEVGRLKKWRGEKEEMDRLAIERDRLKSEQSPWSWLREIVVLLFFFCCFAVLLLHSQRKRMVVRSDCRLLLLNIANRQLVPKNMRKQILMLDWNLLKDCHYLQNSHSTHILSDPKPKDHKLLT